MQSQAKRNIVNLQFANSAFGIQLMSGSWECHRILPILSTWSWALSCWPKYEWPWCIQVALVKILSWKSMRILLGVQGYSRNVSRRSWAEKMIWVSSELTGLIKVSSKSAFWRYAPSRGWPRWYGSFCQGTHLPQEFWAVCHWEQVGRTGPARAFWEVWSPASIVFFLVSEGLWEQLVLSLPSWWGSRRSKTPAACSIQSDSVMRDCACLERCSSFLSACLLVPEVVKMVKIQQPFKLSHSSRRQDWVWYMMIEQASFALDAEAVGWNYTAGKLSDALDNAFSASHRELAQQYHWLNCIIWQSWAISTETMTIIIKIGFIVKAVDIMLHKRLTQSNRSSCIETPEGWGRSYVHGQYYAKLTWGLEWLEWPPARLLSLHSFAQSEWWLE